MKYVFIGLLWLCGAQLTVGQAAWEIGLQGGVAGYMGDLTPDLLPDTELLGLSLGGRVGFNLGKNWLLRIDLERSELKGDDAQFAAAVFNTDRKFSFQTVLYSGSAQLLWEPLAHRRYPYAGGYRNIVSPYVFVGVGALLRDSE